MIEIFYDLKALCGHHATGKLEVKPVNQSLPSWHIYFYAGRIVWATGGNHRIRRWFRTVRQHAPNLITNDWIQTAQARVSELTTEDIRGYWFWELQLIDLAVCLGRISLVQAQTIVSTNIQEIFFDIFSSGSKHTNWTQITESPQHLVRLDLDQLIGQTQRLCAEWQSICSEQEAQSLLSSLSPDLAPIIKQDLKLKTIVSPKTYQALVKLLDNQNTFWDLSVKMKRSIPCVLQSLVPLIQQDVIGFSQISDLNLDQSSQTLPISNGSSKSKGLIACIDDSPLVPTELAGILNPFGYEILSVSDPVKGVGMLLERKPNLIFLDLVMPNTNGYELCSFLRKTVAFKDTPIIMLTGRNTVVDRLRAKVSGTSDFLPKPPDPTKVIQLVQKFLEHSHLKENTELVS